MTDQEFIDKYDKHEEFSEREIEELVWEFPTVSTKYGENRRWSRSVDTIIKVCGRLFCIPWEEGLTEYQEHEYYEQPYEVVEQEKTIVIKEYIRK